MTEDSLADILPPSKLPSMFWAAAFAAALPTALGVIGLFFCFVPTAIGRGAFEDYLFAVPISLCFAFGAPLVAWLSCRALIFLSYEPNPSIFEFFGVWPLAVKYSFYVHGLAFLTHVLVFSLFIGGGDVAVFGLSLFFGGLINAVLFVIVTLPMSLFCAAIFAMLYSAPEITPAQ